MTTPVRLRPVLKYGTRRATGRLLVIARAVQTKMAADPVRFAGPPVSMADLADQIQKVADLQQQVAEHDPDATTPRDAERTVLVTMLEALRAFVQRLSESAEGSDAAVIIEAAGMKVGKRSGYAKPPLRVRRGAVAGTVILEAYARLLNPSRRNKVYGWQWSRDGGVTWMDVPTTGAARTEIDGLTPLVQHSFRVCVRDSRGTTPWSDAVTALVL
jgi:hypothetical protein